MNESANAILAIKRWFLVAICMICVIGTSAYSETNHNAQHTAILAGINHLLSSGCNDISADSSRYVVNYVSETKVEIQSNTLILRCVKSDGLVSYIITWSEPTTREDGQALPRDEIMGYEFIRGDQILGVHPCCTFETDDIEGLKVRTVDKNSLKSKLVNVL